MAVQPGQTLSHYRLIEKIGEGGMGVVWKARDTRLRRDVALKLLPPDLVQTEDRRHRFFREARAAAAISHPHIATVFEVGEAEGHSFIAMELVRGETLRDRVKGGPLAIDEILSIACQVADGLTHAHKASVIHRDLKPDNIMIGSDGHVRILDFGLAKLREDGEKSPLAISQISTISDEMTRAGKVFGTAAYMSPEQARGQTVDERSDTFSFGATLYQIATGQLPFQGATPLDTLTAVLQNEPVPPSTLNQDTPIELERIIRKCLQKKPAERYQDTRDLLVDLRQLKRDTDSQPLQRPSGSAGHPPVEGRGRSARWWAGLFLFVVVVAGAGTILVRSYLGDAKAQPEIEQELLTTNAVDDPVWTAAISPDGRYLAYVVDSGTYLQVLETGEQKRISPLQGVENVELSGWFPDSIHLAVTLRPEGASPSLWSYSIVTGALRKIRDHASGPDMYGAVSPDGRTIAYVPDDGTEEIWLMSIDGSGARRVVAKEEDDTSVNWWVRWSPNSQRVLYRRQTEFPDGIKNGIESCDLQGQRRTQVVEPVVHVYPGIHAEWVPDGRVVFSQTHRDGRMRDNNLWEVRVDVATGRPRDRPRRLTSWVGFFSYFLSSTRDGELAIVRFRNQGETNVASIDPAGTGVRRSRPVVTDAVDDFPVAWKNDGQALLIGSNRRGNNDIYELEIETGTMHPIVATPAEEVPEAISPDGKWILYLILNEPRNVASSDPGTLLRVAIDGGAPETITEVSRWSTVRCGSMDDGRCVLLEQQKDDTVVVAELDPLSGKGQVLAKLPASAAQGDLSPNGRNFAWLEKSEEGRSALKIINLDGGEPRVLETGEWKIKGPPAWAQDGAGLFAFGTRDARRALLRISLEGDLAPLPIDDDEEDLTQRLIVSPDGQHFAFTRWLRESSVWLLSGY